MSLQSILMSAAGAAALAGGGSGQEFTSQPPPGTNVIVKQAWKDKGLKLSLLPGVNDSGGTMREYVQGLSPSVLMPDLSSAPSNPYSTTPNGRVIRLNPTNTDGTSAAVVDFPSSAITSNDLTLFWAGYVDDFSVKSGVVIGRGADTYGNGWSVNLQQLNNTTLRAAYIDSSPASYTVDLTIPSTPPGTFFVACWRKVGNQVSVWFGTNALTASRTGGNGAFRSSTIGLSISNGGDNRPTGTGADVNGRGGSRSRCACWHGFDNGIAVPDVQAVMSNIWVPYTTP